MEIPFLDLRAQNAALKKEILPQWEEILESAGFIGGKYVDLFEEKFAAACEVDHCVAVNSGTDALRFIMTALGLRPGDEVITAPNTFAATAEAIQQAGGTTVFADIDSKTYNIDPELITKAITKKTVGIVPIHLYGQPAAMDEINKIAEEHGLWVIEDACQAHLAEYQGKKAGSLGRAAAFSFYPGKNLGACGDAGAVTTSDGELASQVRSLRDHGQGRKYYHDLVGYNGRCDALQAAALIVKLRYLADWNEQRRAIAKQYFSMLVDANLVLPEISPGCLSAFHLFVVQVENRDNVMKLLSEKGVQVGLHYPVSLHMQKAYKFLGYKKGDLPVSEGVSERLMSLPMFPDLTPKQIEYVGACLKDIVGGVNV